MWVFGSFVEDPGENKLLELYFEEEKTTKSLK